jgi:2-(1,2-epoxy-1,2-dihydrophenyl)acetyl-CoA isomerase
LEYATIEYKEKGPVGIIFLNRPAKRNAINEAMGQELVDCLSRCAEKSSIGAIILTGKGAVFCSGGDIDAQEYFADSAKIKIKKLLNASLPVILEIRRIKKPVIAAVNGAAIGGGFGLALACDLILASKNSFFSSHYIKLGASPDAGLSYFLPRLIGDKRAAWLLFTGEVVSAAAAAELGFVNQVIDEVNLGEIAENLAVKLSGMARLAIGYTKELINLSRFGELEAHIEQEKQLLADLALTEDFKEGLTAFKEKRKPRY